MEPKIGLVAKNRQGVAKILNTLLADEYVLLVMTQNYHWNVLGMNFNDLHLFFGKHYDEISLFVDEIAERVRALGLNPLGTMAEFIKHARLKEIAGGLKEKEMLKNLLHAHEAIIASLRPDITATADEFGDMGTNNFLSGLIEKHEKMAWMLRSYLSA